MTNLIHKPVPRARWSALDVPRIESIAANGGGLVDLWEASPVRLETNSPLTEELVDQLFPSASLLCCGWNQIIFATRPREEWRGQLSGLQYIVPSPMTTHTGHTLAGKLSKRSLHNTGPRKFLVIEFDFHKTINSALRSMILRLDPAGISIQDVCAALLLHLAENAPLAVVVHSGGQSLHGWFYCSGQPEDKLRRTMDYAVSLGADPMTWTKCQFVRMPDGRRDDGQTQRVFFFNSSVIP